MANYNFTQRDRNKKSNQPITYDITRTTSNNRPAGTLTKLKNNWHLDWEGISAKFPSRYGVYIHLKLLGHTITGL